MPYGLTAVADVTVRSATVDDVPAIAQTLARAFDEHHRSEHLDGLTRVEIVTMRPIPAARARDTIPSRSSAKSGKSRWQWLSTNILRSPYAAGSM